MNADRIVSMLLEDDEIDPKDFVERGGFRVPRVARLRFSDMAVQYDPEDPIVHWAFLIWELERVGREPRRGMPQLGLNDEEWAYVNAKKELFLEPSPDANARGSAYITKYGLKPEAWQRIRDAFGIAGDVKGYHVVEVSQNVPQFTESEVDPKDFLNDHPEIGGMEYWIRGSHGIGWGSVAGPFKSEDEAVAYARAHDIMREYQFGRISKVPSYKEQPKLDFLRQCSGRILNRDYTLGPLEGFRLDQ